MRKNYRKRKFNQKRKSTYKVFFLILVGMTLGFAAINTTLQLIGTLNISRTTWDVHWENPTKTGGVTATQDVHLKNNDNTTVEYQVKLTNPGDYYEFTVDAVNNGTIDAMITSVSNKVYENNVEVNPTYLESTITYSDGNSIENNHLLKSNSSETYKVKVQYKTGLTPDQLPDSEKTYNYRFNVTYMQADETNQVERINNYPYRDSPYEFVAPKDGTYKIELWGAQGGSTAQNSGGRGGYTSGNIVLTKNDVLYIYVGQEGMNSSNTIAYNGGGKLTGETEYSTTGGGATDIRLVSGTWDDFDSLKSRIMVAGAGGGSYSYPTSSFLADGAAGGGLIGLSGSAYNTCRSTGGTQTSGGICSNSSAVSGSFGKGGNAANGRSSGGGSGYYGGAARYDNSGSGSGAGGGSSFISGYSGCDAIAESSTSNNIIHTGQPNHYNSTKVFTNSIMIDGTGCNWSTGVATNCGANQPQPDGTMAIGHTGNGYARITSIN